MSEPRTATVRLDRVRPGWTFVGSAREGFAVGSGSKFLPAQVISSRPNVPPMTRGKNVTRIVTWEGGFFAAAPSHQVRVLDETGMIQLNEDVEVYGPYVTTTTFDGEKAGSIHFSNVEAEPLGVVKADLVIRRDNQTLATLEGVEVGHLKSMAAHVLHKARTGHTWCSVCKTYHDNPGERTDAGRVTRPCPHLPSDDPRNLA